MEKCHICGYTSSRHLIHTDDGHCYCTEHYLLHVLHDKGQRISVHQKSS
ncbi:MAG: hypothetical protein ACTSSG_01085 [Candidatus Heimdallarchaeaceae archaeon]